MPYYFLGTFTEHPYTTKNPAGNMFFEHAFLPDSILLKFAYVPAFILSFYASCVERISIFLCKAEMLVVSNGKIMST